MNAERKSRLASATVARARSFGLTTRILVVDQDRQVGIALGFMLAALQYEDVRVVRSARRAVAIAGLFRPEIVLLDLELPEETGSTVMTQLMREVRVRRPRLIALTRHEDGPARKEARAAGFERFLLKPVSHEALEQALGLVRATASA